MPAPLLELRDLTVRLGNAAGAAVLDGLTFQLAPGEVLGIVGESGAGKSVTGAAILRLLTSPLCQTSGEIRFEGARIDNLAEAQMQRLRGGAIAMVFQDPLTALNPVFTIGQQLVQTIRQHLPMSAAQARGRAVQLLREVGIPSAEERLTSYPHEFSGGMRQRVVIALALAGEPRLIVADEPTTALDVSIQAQIIALLVTLSRNRGMGVILITHDMGVIAEAADRVAVLYAGQLAELGPVAEVLRHPHHPYAQGLIAAIPKIGAGLDMLPQIRGTMPRIDALPPGCPFHPRCDRVMPICRTERPEPMPRSGGTLAACWLEESA
ncbi:ABC transporter ATP-binding protein [Pararhodobacter sp. SW119]|uniref:ABC transporter ATP-binding protein n=1 Tax=Pararhodobacter sp. SW119 TaxID=2780075 RepID=UPI001ADFD697|nr:ABC transporter ATP-binding protein [Pararhodobacter sp. SW119]